MPVEVLPRHSTRVYLHRLITIHQVQQKCLRFCSMPATQRFMPAHETAARRDRVARAVVIFISASQLCFAPVLHDGTITITRRSLYTCSCIRPCVWIPWVINPDGILILVSGKCRDNSDICVAVWQNLYRRKSCGAAYSRQVASIDHPAFFSAHSIN